MIKILKNLRYRVERDGEVISQHKYKKDAKKAVKLAKDKILKMPDTDILSQHKITGPELKKPKTKIKGKIWQHHEDKKIPTIKFPKSWIDRGKERLFEQPTEFIRDLNLPMPHLNLVPANSKIQWISSRQIKEYMNDRRVTMEFVRSSKGNWKADEYYRYFVPYDEACKIVEKFKK